MNYDLGLHDFVTLSKDTNELNKILKNDKYTYTHSVNVANYAVEFSEKLNADFSNEVVYLSGLFHDIGKTSLNQRILHKKSALTDEEVRYIKEHPSLGFRLLACYKLPPEVMVAAKYHHERYNGKGYPLGLVSRNIPEIARIISICDVYDALTSDRPYRDAFDPETAKQMMLDMNGHFDPEMLKVFFE